MGRATLVIFLLWLLFFAADRMFPYMKPGTDIIYDTKADTLCKLLTFPKDARHKVVVFGDSTILSGFVPERFDSLNVSTASFNMGLPNSSRFIEQLEFLVRRGQVPTHVLFSVAWSPEQERSMLSLLPSDETIVNALFPFRELPRNFCLFMRRSASRGGIRRYYEYGRMSAQKMIEDRGYYFIEGQSLFPGHRLPDEFRRESDHPDEVYSRHFDLTSDVFARLEALHAVYGIQFCIVPYYYREGAWAAPPAVSQNSAHFSGHEGFTVLGPECLLFPNRYFSDFRHLNPEGAQLYTEKLAVLFSAYTGRNEAPPSRSVYGPQGLERQVK